MNEKTKTGLEILQAAVLVGILGDVMLRQTPWGLNVLLFIGGLVAAYVMLVRRRRTEFWNAPTLALNGALVFFAAMFAWRDSEELKVFDTLAIFTILAVLILPALRLKLPLAGVFHYFIGFVWSGINALFGPFLLFIEDIEWKAIPQTGWKRHLVSIFRGLLIAVPLLLVFGALFMAADAVFQGIVERTFNIDPEIVFTHLLLAGFLSWITAGFLRGALAGEPVAAGASAAVATPPLAADAAPVASVTALGDDDAPKAEAPPPEENSPRRNWPDFDNSVLPRFFTLGAIEVTIVLGLVNLLFLSFVIVQLPYLFGGFELVQNTPDFKLAEYARRGFGELVAVAALVLPILLGTHWLLRKDAPANEKIYRVLAGIQIALLFVIMLSAAQRLFILTGNLGYGLTTVRFYPFVVMVWLAVVFLWFAATVLRGARAAFAWGALWSALVILGALHFVNPDDYIARTNLRLMKEGRPFDAEYNARLSDDALPALLENYGALAPDLRRAVEIELGARLCRKLGEKDFRSWNWARSRANAALLANPSVVAVAGDCHRLQTSPRGLD